MCITQHSIFHQIFRPRRSRYHFAAARLHATALCPAADWPGAPNRYRHEENMGIQRKVEAPKIAM